MPPELQIDHPARRLHDIMWSFGYQTHAHWVGIESDATPASGTKDLGNIRNVVAVLAPEEEHAQPLDEFDRVVWTLAISRDPAEPGPEASSYPWS